MISYKINVVFFNLQYCITTALRTGKKECPTCRTKLASKRSLRPDPKFDALIKILFPDQAELEKEQIRIQKIAERNSNALIKSMETNLSSKDASKRKNKKKIQVSITEEMEIEDNRNEQVNKKPKMEEISSVSRTNNTSNSVRRYKEMEVVIKQKPKDTSGY